MTTVEIAPRALRPPVRVRRPPQYEPPFDDERPSGHETSPDQLALSWPAHSPAPASGRLRGRDGPGRTDEFGDEEQHRAHPDELTRNGLGRAARIAVIAARAATAEPSRHPVTAEPSRHPVTAEPSRRPAQHQTGSVGVGSTGSVGSAGAGSAVAGSAGAGSAGAGSAGGGSAGAGSAGGGSAGVIGALGAEGDARLAVRRFVTACVEVFNGYRPAAHLRRLSQPAEAARVIAQAMAGAHRVSELRRPSPKRQVPRARRRPAPVAVLKVQLCEPRPGAIEASVVLVTGERTWALALRMETHEETWLATALRLV